MAKVKANIGVWLVVLLLVYLLLRKQPTTTETPAISTGRTGNAGSGGSGGGGGDTSIITTPTTGLTITGVGQTVTGLTVPQTVTFPARVINLQAIPSGMYSGTAVLKTTGGTVLHTEILTDLNVSNTGYPAIYFNPQHPTWNIPGAGTYIMQVSLTIQGTSYTASTQLVLTNTDLGIVEGGGTGIELQNYNVSNGNQAVLSLSGGTIGESVTILLKKAGTTVGTLTAAYAASMTVTSSAYGYLDVFVGGTDIGSIYVPEQVTGSFTVQRAKAVNDGIMSIEINKVGSNYILTDTADNSGWANVEYWHSATFLGASVPANYAIEPNVIHHITKKVWGSGGNWISYDGDPNPKQKRQQTLKIVSA